MNSKLISIPRTSISALLLGAALTIALCPVKAEAQALGQSGDVTLSAERMFGFYGGNRHQERPNDNDIDTDPSGVGIGFHAPISVFTTPRVGIDVFIVDSLSLGGSLGFYSNDDDGDDGVERSGVIFAPRVGYAISFNDQWGFWPRGGLTYFSTDNPDRSVAALSGEGAFYFMPTPSVGFTGSVILDLGFTGEEEVGNADYDYNEQILGIGFGMFGRF